MKLRPVLVVTPFFAPQNHAAVYRAYKLVKYLPEYGWKPIVLTVDEHYLYSENPAMLEALPPEVEIVKARYVEPTLRGLRMALGGKSRTFRDLETQPATKGSQQDDRAPSLSRRLYQQILRRWVQVPDAHVTWGREAIQTGRRLIRERGIELVFTSAPPYSSLLVGMALQREGVPWVSDYRDPLGYSARHVGENAKVQWKQRQIVQQALAHADVSTAAGNCFSSIYSDVFGALRKPMNFIPTGVDFSAEGNALANDPPAHPYLLFAGEVQSDFDSVFWETFGTVMQSGAVRQRDVRILIVGTLALNRPRLAPLLDRYGLWNYVEFRDQVPQAEVYRLLRGALAGLLMPGTHSFWWTHFAKMTDCIGLSKPVLAVVPDPSEARTALTRACLGIFLDGDPRQRAETLSKFLMGRIQMPQPNEKECKLHTVRSQVESFVEIFEELTGTRGTTSAPMQTSRAEKASAK